MHLLLDHDGYLPSFSIITEGKVPDVQIARQFNFDTDTIVVDDRGYSDYELFAHWTAQGVYFVTRMKDNAVFEVAIENKVPQNRHILKGEIIELRGLMAYEKCPYPLRRIEFYDSVKKEILVFLTNHLTLESVFNPYAVIKVRFVFDFSFIVSQ